MATIKKFEDLEIWQQALTLDKEIYLLAKTGFLAKDFDLKNQMLSSVGSAMDNIAEGFERGGNKEFIQFLSISKGSMGELRSQLHRCRNREYINHETHEELVKKCEAISEKISRFMNYLRKSEYKGNKYKNN